MELNNATEHLADLKMGLDRPGEQCPLAQFLIGEGEAIFADASDVLQRRQGEMDNQTKVDEMLRTARDLVRCSTGSAQVLEQASSFFKELVGMLKRKKGQSPLSAQQLTALQEQDAH
eukprot:9865354-Karenia_brevis.AAC.1